ncbi:MAG: right-handed parallel beta-helix repeat-containing protein, partial [Candidatus Cloacimonetes bacterium]|nr:right-handed parallel beta-helix repeat-containing protein [Candidatus Cloacimonadota bacterium]
MRKYNFIFFTFLSRRLVTPQACKGGINILLAFLCVGGLFFAFSIAYAIEVGGHLTEDTIWGPENNPYLVTGGIYVDVGVTLTILPGTIVKLNAALFDAAGDDDFYFSGGEEPVAKFIRVDGRIIAEGTEQDSIIFTRLQDEQYFHWGTVYLPENAQPSRFSYCLFEFSAFTGFSLAEQPHGGISMWNGSAKIEKCAFIDNDTAIYIRNNVTDIQIIKNYFDYYEYPHPNIIHISGMDFIGIHYIFNTDIGSPLIAGNIFMHGTATYSSKSMYFVDNSIESVTFYRDAIYMSSTYGKSYFYNNEIGSCSTGINSFSTGTDSLYIKNNYFATNGGEGIEIDNAYVEVSDNYFEGCDLYTEYTTGKIWNNISNNGEIWTPGEIEVYNNICYNNVGYGLKVGYNPYCVNNISINNEYDIWSATVSYENCIIINNEELTQHVINGNPVFRNCIIDFELEYPLIDGGGNIIIDSLQAQQIFQDIQNGDFHLIEGSLA